MIACWRARGSASYASATPSGWSKRPVKSGGVLATVQGRVRGFDAVLDRRSGGEPFTVADLLLAVGGCQFVELLLVVVERLDQARDRGVAEVTSSYRGSQSWRFESVDDRGDDERLSASSARMNVPPHPSRPGSRVHT